MNKTCGGEEISFTVASCLSVFTSPWKEKRIFHIADGRVHVLNLELVTQRPRPQAIAVVQQSSSGVSRPVRQS
jgi:hypothetical protein